MKEIRGQVLLTNDNERVWNEQDIEDEAGNKFTADVLAGNQAEAERFVADVTREVNFKPVNDMRERGTAAEYRRISFP